MKTFINKNILLLFFLLSSLMLTAQNHVKEFGKSLATEQRNPETGLVRCASSSYEEYLRAKDPERQTIEQFESWLAPKIEAYKAQRLASPDNTSNVITIPVVVHVIHDGDPVGVSENIRDAQIISQITVLNQDYRMMAGTPGESWIDVAADTEIEFCLAQQDPDGNPTTGIDRVDLGTPSWDSRDMVENFMKPDTQWDPTRYLNIWVCRFGGPSASQGGLGDILGYAQFPAYGVPGLGGGGSSEFTDGVVIGYRYFGSRAIYPQGSYDNTYSRGRTTTHEVGHFLGLRHVNGDNSSCSVNASDSNKDFCPDTPAIAYLHYGCESGDDSCPFAPGQDMVENYMDYSDDTCMNTFTQDQKTRMRTVLQVSPRRASLVTSNACQSPTNSNKEFELLNGINLYPNPTQSVLNIQLANNDLPDSYVIYNSLGQTVVNTKVSSAANLSINTSAYSNGIYFIKINKGNQSKTLKFVKN